MGSGGLGAPQSNREGGRDSRGTKRFGGKQASICCVTLKKLLNLSEPQLPLLEKRTNRGVCSFLVYGVRLPPAGTLGHLPLFTTAVMLLFVPTAQI